MTTPRPRVVFCTARQTIIDFVRDGAGESDEDAIRRLAPDYGTALTAMPAAEAQTLYEAQFKTPVQEITEEAFYAALELLPPVGWARHSGGECFRLSERIAGRVTAIYVAMHGRHFTFSDDIRTPHQECLKRVAAFIAATPPATGKTAR